MNELTNTINDTILSDVQLERSLLGALLVDSTAFGKVKDILTAKMFADRHNGEVFQAASDAYADGGSVDLITITQAAKRSGTLDSLGGPAYLASLTQAACTGAHAESWAYIIADKHNRRNLMHTLNDMTIAVMDEGMAVDSVILQLRTAFETFATSMAIGTPVPPAKEGISEAYSELAERMGGYRNGQSSHGIPTGLTELDRALGGFKGGNLYVLAGRPAMGKTAMMLHLATIAAESGHPTVVFSLEMSRKQVADRMILCDADGIVTGEEYSRGAIDDMQYDYISKRINPLCDRPLYIDDCGGATMQYIHNKARRMRDEGRCDIVLIDYLQLVSNPDTAARRNATREQEVSQMSRQAKVMARELGIPVVLLSQLSRSVEQRSDKRPVLSDLRESGAIEQDADVVMFLYRPSYYNEYQTADGTPIPPDSGEVIISKNRHGRTGSVAFRHNESLTKIFEY